MAREYRYEPRHDTPFPPGEHIREILEDRGITQSDFAVRMGKSEKFISQLINGRVSLTYDTAVELERVLGVPSSFWNNGEAIYRDALAWQRQQAESAEQAEWAKSFPLKEMEKQGFIARETAPAEKTGALLSYFGVSTIDAYTNYWGSEKRLAARMSTAYTPETPALTAWLRAGELAAEKIRTEPFAEGAFRELLVELRGQTRTSPGGWRDMIQRRCAEVGVAVVFVPDLPRTRCFAVSWWASRDKAVIEIGSRYKTDDHFWFSFFHEAGHLLLDDRRRTGISDLDGDSESEARANGFAADLLIPPYEYATFVRTGPLSKTRVIEFADCLGIAPGILVGRLQQDGTMRPSWMNDLKRKLAWS